MSGSSSASSVRPANSAVRWVGSTGSTRASSVAGGNECVRRARRPSARVTHRVADPRGGPAHHGDLAGGGDGPDGDAAGRADADLGDAHRPGPAEGHLVAHVQLARPQPHPRTPAALVAVDGEDGAGGRAGVAPPAVQRARQHPDEHVAQLRRAGAGDGGAAHDGRQEALPHAVPQRAEHVAVPDPLAGHPPREQRVVGLGHGSHDRVVVEGERGDPGVATALPMGAREGYDGGGQPPAYLLDDPLDVRAGPVDLVDEEDGGDADPLQRAPDHDALRLHALDGGQHQHGRVENAQRALDLGDEVGVARGVDEVDGAVAPGTVQWERRDRRADGDAAASLEGHRVGAGRARVDAADGVGDARLEEEALGQAGLAGVNVRDDPEVER